MWPLRHIWLVRSFARATRSSESGLTWCEYGHADRRDASAPLSIAFAFVATHNHFVLDRGGKVFNRSAPVIKLTDDATEDDHLALLGVLNSSTACFWMKQVCHNKGGGGVNEEPSRMGAWRSSTSSQARSSQSSRCPRSPDAHLLRAHEPMLNRARGVASTTLPHCSTEARRRLSRCERDAELSPARSACRRRPTGQVMGCFRSRCQTASDRLARTRRATARRAGVRDPLARRIAAASAERHGSRVTVLTR